MGEPNRVICPAGAAGEDRTMSISFNCPHCHKPYRVDDSFAGRHVQCKACGGELDVPRTAELGVLEEIEPVQPAATVAAPAAVPPPLPPLARSPKPLVPIVPGPPGSMPLMPPAAKPALPPQFATPPVAPPPMLPPMWPPASPGLAPSRRGAPGPARRSGGVWKIVLPIVAVVLLGIGAGVFLAGRAIYRAVQKAAGNAGGITTITPADFPPRPAMRQLEPGVQFCEISHGDVSETGLRLWLYLPGGPNAPRPPKSLPCVLIAPAGSNLVSGMDLGDGDRAEHLPYVRAGYAVLAYELDGHIPGGMKSATELQMRKAIRQFMHAEGGQANARAAIDYLIANVPEVDPSHLYAAGHSSAGTLAVQLAANEPRLRGAIAYAPCTDLESRLGPNLVTIDSAVPGLRDFVRRTSPKNLGPPRCPLLVFHARDDENVPVGQSEAYVGSHPNVTLITVSSGGHYKSMMAEGVPRGIAWLRSQGANPLTDGLATVPPRLPPGFPSGVPTPPNFPAPRAGFAASMPAAPTVSAPPSPPAPKPPEPPELTFPPPPTTDPGGRELAPFAVDRALEAQLGTAARVGPYTIRPPADFQRTAGADGGTRATWTLRQPSRRTTTTLTIAVAPRTDTASEWPIVVTDPAAPRRARQVNVAPGADLSYGTINSRPFIRTEHVTKVAGGQTSRTVIQYLAFDGPNYVTIQLTCVGTDPQPRDAAETAIRTLK